MSASGKHSKTPFNSSQKKNSNIDLNPPKKKSNNLRKAVTLRRFHFGKPQKIATIYMPLMQWHISRAYDGSKRPHVLQ